MTSEYKASLRYEVPFTPEQCKASVYHEIPSGFHQCRRKPWKDGWCKQHHPDTEAKRRQQRQGQREARDAHRREYGPWAQLRKAREEIARLKARIAELEKQT